MSFHQKRLKISVSVEVINTIENLLANAYTRAKDDLANFPNDKSILKELSHIDRFDKAVETAKKRY